MATQSNEDYSSDPPGEFDRATLREMVAPIFRHARAGLLVAMVLLAATIIAIVASPRLYDAEMTLLVKRERADTIVSADPGSSTQGRGDVTEDELNSEVELLKSRDLLGQVAIASGLLASTQPAATGEGGEVAAEPLARAVRKLSSNLDVRPLRKTNIIKVAYSSPDPTLAAKVLSELGDRYLEKHLVLHRPAGAYDFFSAQTERFRSELSDAEAQLKAYGRHEQVVSADVEKESTLRQLAEFEASLQQTHAQLADSTRRLRELETVARSTPTRQTTQVRTSDNPQLITELRGRVLELETNRAEMLRKFTPSYPLVIELEGKLAQARAALEVTVHTPLTDETTDANPTHQWVETELARISADRGAAVARAAAIAASVQLYQEKARQLEEKGSVQQELKRTMKNAEDNYQLYLRKQEEARISDALDRTRISNVAIAEAPTVPALPSSGGRLRMLLLGCLMSCVAGLATTYAANYMSPYFNTPAEVEAALNIPVLATLPASR